MDSLLAGLFGGQDPNDSRAKAEDFVNRVETGDPTEGFSDEEALKGFSGVASQLSPNELEDAATEALDRFSPEQRQQFAGLLEQASGGTAHVDASDSRQVAQLTSQLQSQSPDGLVGLLGGGSLDSILGGLAGGGSSGGGGGLINDLLGGLLGGGDKGGSSGAAAPSQAGGLNDLLSNPIAKAILAAIAAMAMKKFMGGGGGLPSFGGGGDAREQQPSRGGDNNPFDGGNSPFGGDSDAPKRKGGLQGGQSSKA